MLLAMATGTGKTVTMVNEIYRLLKSGTARRVLFLVDRRALAAQAVRAFASFEPEPGLKFDKVYEVYSQRFFRQDLSGEGFDPNVLPTSYLTKPEKGKTFVYVSTIQRMAINLYGKEAVFGDDTESSDEEDAEQLHIPTNAFDVVIADECHRGYSSSELSVWRNTIDHFDAIKIGLTATPAAHRHGHRPSRSQTSRSQTFGCVDSPRMQRQHASRTLSASADRRILEELKRYTTDHEERYGRFPKMLIFAANDDAQGCSAARGIS